MSTEIQRPWAPTELHETKPKSLVDQIVVVLKALWPDNTENVQDLAMSTDKDDSINHSVNADKILLASAVIKLAANIPGCEDLAQSYIPDVNRVMHHAQKKLGVDRTTLMSRKEQFLAIRHEQQPDAETASV